MNFGKRNGELNWPRQRDSNNHEKHRPQAVMQHIIQLTDEGVCYEYEEPSLY